MSARRAAAVVLALLAAAGAASCATRAGDAEAGRIAEQAAAEMMKTSFKTRGQASVERLRQDEVQALCSKYSHEVPRDVREKIERAQLASIRYPASGKLMGDWREGERVAQSGVGKQFNDDPSRPSGGNCYACHRLSSEELSFGTIGPSLHRFGKLRGSGPEVQRYVYGKIYNSEAYSACSNMPRFGHNQILTETQITHLVALLLDPESPVNK
jgi:L-cysteine S-thiosulfotransferase